MCAFELYWKIVQLFNGELDKCAKKKKKYNY